MAKEYIERQGILDDVRNTMFTMSMCLTKDELHGMRLAQQIIAKKIETYPAADVAPVVTESPYMQAAIDSVIDERKRQINIWGCQYDASMFEFMSILGEEYGELCEAVNETCFKNPKHPERGGLYNVYEEASHVAAVAVKFMEALLSGGADMRQKEVDKCND